jgi:hypothetical protein
VICHTNFVVEGFHSISVLGPELVSPASGTAGGLCCGGAGSLAPACAASLLLSRGAHSPGLVTIILCFRFAVPCCSIQNIAQHSIAYTSSTVQVQCTTGHDGLVRSLFGGTHRSHDTSVQQYMC